MARDKQGDGKDQMPHAETFWLTVTNVGLGVGVGLCVLITAIGMGRDILVRRKQVSFWHERDDKR